MIKTRRHKPEAKRKKHVLGVRLEDGIYEDVLSMCKKKNMTASKYIHYAVKCLLETDHRNERFWGSDEH